MTALRELWEETKISVAPFDLQLVGVDRALDVPFTTYVTQVRGVPPRVRLRRRELTDYVWAGPSQVVRTLDVRLHDRYRRAARMLGIDVLQIGDDRR